MKFSNHNFYLLFFLFVGCSSQKLSQQSNQIEKQEQNVSDKPSWTTIGKHPLYSSPQYVVGVGLASASGDATKDRLNAEQNAFFEITRQIFAQVSSEISVEKIEVVGDKVETVFGKTENNSTIKSSLTVSGLAIVERYYDANEKIFYSLGVLDKIVACMPIRSLLLQLKDNYEKSLKFTEQQLLTGKLLTSLANLRSAYSSAKRYEENFSSFQLLALKESLSEFENTNAPSPLDALNKFSDILSRLQLKITDGDNQKFITGKPLTNPLTVKVVIDSLKEIPMENIPIHFRFEAGQGTLTEKATTNTNGIASSTVENVERSDEEMYSVSAQLNVHELVDTVTNADDWNKRLKLGERKLLFHFECKRPKKGTKILILVEQTHQANVRSTIAREALLQEFSDAGFSTLTENDIGSENIQAIKDAVKNSHFSSLQSRFSNAFDIVVVGEISCKQLNDVEGMKIFNANGLVKAVLMKTGETLGAESFKNVRGFGNTVEQAAENTIHAAAEQAANKIIIDVLSFF